MGVVGCSQHRTIAFPPLSCKAGGTIKGCSLVVAVIHFCIDTYRIHTSNADDQLEYHQ